MCSRVCPLPGADLEGVSPWGQEIPASQAAKRHVGAERAPYVPQKK